MEAVVNGVCKVVIVVNGICEVVSHRYNWSANVGEVVVTDIIGVLM